MKFTTPEVAWHNRDPVYSVDIQPCLQTGENGSGDWYRVATSGADSVIIIWKVHQPQSAARPSRIDQDNVLSQLVRHEKAVNVVRFVPTGEEMLASADVDGVIIIWKKGDMDRFTADLANGKSNISNGSPKNHKNGGKSDGRGEPSNGDNGCGFEDGIDNIENWNQHKVLKGHLEDVVDISWSADGLFMVSGSVDNEAIVWDVTKGTKTHMLSGHKSWVQGVAWDPIADYLGTISADRSLRIFSQQTKRIVHRVEKASLMHGDQLCKTRLFYDYTLQSFTRRLSFSPAGEFLLVPSGVLEFPRPEPKQQLPKKNSSEDKKEVIAEVIEICDENSGPEQQVTPAATAAVAEPEINYINVCHIFLRNNLQKPFAYLPTHDRYCHAVRFCPTRFRLHEGEENPFPFPYRIIFAIATQDSVILYDTQHLRPFAFISEIHYTRISDITWSRDGRLLIISSTDGFCTLVSFDEKELGEVYEGEAYKFEPEVKDTKDVTNNGAASTPAKSTKSRESAATAAITPKTSGSAVKSTPKVPTPSVAGFFGHVSRDVRMETVEKQLQQLKSEKPERKRKEFITMTPTVEHTKKQRPDNNGSSSS